MIFGYSDVKDVPPELRMIYVEFKRAYARIEKLEKTEKNNEDLRQEIKSLRARDEKLRKAINLLGKRLKEGKIPQGKSLFETIFGK